MVLAGIITDSIIGFLYTKKIANKLYNFDLKDKFDPKEFIESLELKNNKDLPAKEIEK